MDLNSKMIRNDCLTMFFSEDLVMNIDDTLKKIKDGTVKAAEYIDTAGTEITKFAKEFKEEFDKEMDEEIRTVPDEARKKGVIMQADLANGIIELYPDRVSIRRHGLRAALGHGLFQGNKEILISSITAVQMKKPSLGILVGYIQFSILGGNEGTKGLTEATSDENTVTIDSMFEYEAAEAIRDKIYEIKNRDNIIPSNGESSIADELIKLQQLKESGVITEEEFQSAKDKLLK